MGLIERAAQRLEELRHAGAEVPEAAAAPIVERVPAERPASARIPAHPPADPIPLPSAAAQRRHERATPERITIDLVRLAAMGFLTPDHGKGRLAEEFRILKRPLIENARPGTMITNSNVVMVTSAVPGEGKTFSAINLAMSMAMEVDRSVLLVDGDVARPSVPKILNIAPQRGLMDVLADPSLSLQDVVAPTNVPRLSLLMAGTPQRRPSEMLASDAMARLVEELATRDPQRIVVFDSPPLLATTEARQLAARVGQIVFVVRAEATMKRDVQGALASIEACPVKLLVLNGATSAGQGTYGYGYGYGYGHGYGG